MNFKYLYVIGCLAVSSLVYSQQNIFDVARFGTVEDVKALMTINTDTINSVEKSGYSPLILACYKGNDDVAMFLAEKVCDVNVGGENGTALMAAVYKNRETIVKTLLDFGADPNIADANRTTPMHYAVIMRNTQVIELLLRADADFTLKDGSGKTAKEYASMTQNETIIELFEKE